MKITTRLLLLLVSASCAGGARADRCEVFRFESPGYTYIPIDDARIFPLQFDRRAEALALLDGKSYMPLSWTEVTKVTGGLPWTADELLQRQIDTAHKHSQNCANEKARSSNPRFAELSGASQVAYEKYATYAEHLPKVLFPYLVAAEVYSEFTGFFSALLDGKKLVVLHASLGGGASPQKVPVLVFSEIQVDAVFAEGSAAR